MNTKHPKYKEFLFLQREQEKLSKYYKDTQPKDIRYISAYMPVDYTEVKEIITATQTHKQYTNGWRNWKTVNDQKAVFVYPTDELVQLDTLLDICKRVRNYKGTNLQGVAIDESEYNNLPENLQLYFRVKKNLKFERIGYKWVKGKTIEWFINEEGKSESRYVDGLIKESIIKDVIYNTYLYKYNTEIKYVDDVKYVYRYHILSDIKKQYDYLDHKEKQLARKYGFWGNPYPKHWKKQSHRKSRVCLKRTLDKAIRLEDYDICSSNEKYHLPHCDRWIWH